MIPRALRLAVLPTVAAANGLTCTDLMEFYRGEDCCGKPEQPVAGRIDAATCPYNFNKPLCTIAEPQAPRDLRMLGNTYAPGMMDPKAATLDDEQADELPLVNVHYHFGAEHRSDHYSDGAASFKYDSEVATRRLSRGDEGRRLAENVRPGFMCSLADLSPWQYEAYQFQHCKGQVEVGKSYEVHYVHSSAGYSAADLASMGVDAADSIGDGLGGAANGRGLLNPMVVVQSQVFQIVVGGANYTDMLHGWKVVGHADSVMYPGSTTGPSHNNQVCSPYSITWHVDKACHRVSPQSFDMLCKQMKDMYNLEADLYPHGSRVLVAADYVVKPEYVLPLA